MNTKVHILMIDDDAALTRALKLNLEDTGRYEVSVINHPGAAIEVAKRNPPDVVLLDVMMPSVNGAEIASAMLETPALAHIPVIFMTALVRKAEQKSLHDHKPARRYLGKPVTVPELEAAILEVLEPSAPQR